MWCVTLAFTNSTARSNRHRLGCDMRLATFRMSQVAGLAHPRVLIDYEH